jgi:serine/threonine-protein kinase
MAAGRSGEAAMIGHCLGRYRVIELIGSGGMGAVYRAYDPTLERDVALKLLHEETLDSEAARARFLSEARALSHLNHPHICTVYEIGEADGRTFIAMEYVPGRALSSVIPGDGLPFETVVHYGAQIASAIAHAHDHGIVHRDLKSANVIVTSGGEIKVLDFGLARRFDVDRHGANETQAPITRPGVVLGTPGYMAPEAIVGQPADVRTDVWAVGIILYEMASGALPFSGSTSVELASAILKDPPSALPARVSPGLQGVVQRCLAKEPGQRYQSAGEVRAALETASGSVAFRQAPGSVAARQAPSRRRVHLYTAVAVAAAAALLVAAVMVNRAPRVDPAAPIRSLAVLPLENLSGDAEQEYFADGMTEQLTADLSSIATLRVISRTSVMQYKKARKPLSAIARELNVEAIVEGSVVRAGDTVRITARLVRAGTEETLWAQSYARDLRDVLRLQSEVAKRIASEIDITLTPQEQTRLARAAAVDPEIHQLLLLGSFHTNRGTEEGMKKGIEYFELAIAKAPDGAAAYAGLAEAYTNLSSWYVGPRIAMPKAKAAAETAVRLDDSLDAAHAALGFVHLLYDWDAVRAERELRRAIELNPSNAAARLGYGAYLATQQRLDEAAEEIRQAARLDPLSIRTHTFGVFLLILAKRNDEAIALAAKGLELNPGVGLTRVLQAVALAEQGRYPEALRTAQQAEHSDPTPTVLGLGAHVHAAVGDKKTAEKMLEQLKATVEHRYFCPYEIGTAYVTLRDFDTAAKWFRKGVEDRADCMAWLGVEPWIEPFRSDPRYPQLLRDVGLSPAPTP